MKNIVILGGSFAGISTAHRLLKQAAKTGPFKITLVAPNTHFYWCIAAPRGFIPGQFDDEQLFRPIADGFQQYPPSQFSFIPASGESLDVEAKKLSISGSHGSQTLDYDFLIIATGSRTKEVTPFKGLGTTEATKKALHDFQERVKEANTIVVAGGGVTGVEAAGELGFAYGRQKSIVLIASGPMLLESSPAMLSKYAIKELQTLKVDIKLQTRIKESVTLPNGRQELTLSDGRKLTTDMYIPTFGLTPNTSYIPVKFLNGKGEVMVDEYLKVKGVKDVWAIGDVADTEKAQFIRCDRQSIHVAKNVILVLNGKATLPYKPAATDFMGFQIGKKAGTGHFGSIKMPTFMVVWARKTLFIENLEKTVNGSMF